MKKFVAALLASTCIVGTAYAQEVPFKFNGHYWFHDGDCTQGLIDPNIGFIKNFNGLDYFVGLGCGHQDTPGTYNRFTTWLYKTSNTNYVADFYAVDCGAKTSQRQYTASGQTEAAINSSITPVSGAVVAFGNIQPITTAARAICAALGSLQ